MRQDLPLSRVAGIRVGANWTFAVILALSARMLVESVLPGAAPHQAAALSWVAAIAAAVLVLLSLPVHELSRALMARRPTTARPGK